MKARCGVNEVLSASAQLAADTALSRRERRLRDRAIGRSLPPEVLRDDVRALSAWARQVEQGHRWETLRSAMQGVTVVLWAVSLLSGVAAAAAVLNYSGDAPVNVLTVLGVLVVLPGVVLLAGVVFMLLGVPAGLVSVGGWAWSAAMHAVRKVQGPVERLEIGDAVGLKADRRGIHPGVPPGVARWCAFVWAQGAGLGFGIGTLLAVLGYVVFTDLAFGWNTTLDIESQRFAGLVQAIGLPWGRLWANAVPSNALVEGTRIFRARSTDIAAPGVAELARGWWGFVVMTIAVYAVLPRVIAWAVGRWRLGVAYARAIALLPGAERVLQDMREVEVESVSQETGGKTREAQEQSSAVGRRSSEHDKTDLTKDASVVMSWAGAHHEAGVLQVGGANTLEQDREAIARAALSDHSGRVRLHVKGWEPPVLEVLDFLGDLRKAVGAERVIEVAIHRTQETSDTAVGVWQRKLASLNEEHVRSGVIDG
jgi:hypothetical protein